MVDTVYDRIAKMSDLQADEPFTVYMHTNENNGKRYVGYTKLTLLGRWHVHLKMARLGSPQLFHKAIRKHGPQVWRHDVLCRCLSEDDAKRAEARLIEEHSSYAYDNPNTGYNLTRGGDGTRGHHHTQDARQRIGTSTTKRCRKLVYQCDTIGNVITTYPSVQDAAVAVKGLKNKVSEAARGVRPTYKGFTWRYAKNPPKESP